MSPTTAEFFAVPAPGKPVTLRLTRSLAEEFISSDWAASHEDNPRIGRELHALMDDGADSVEVKFAGGELNALMVDRVRVPGVKHPRRAVQADDVVFIRCEAIAAGEIGVQARNLILAPLPDARLALR